MHKYPFKYNDIRHQIRIGDMIGCRSAGKVGRLIRHFKGGEADLSHVATVFTDTKTNPKGRVSVLEAVGGGMRVSPLTATYAANHGDLFWMPMVLSDSQRKMVVNRGWKMLDGKKKYDYSSTVKAIFSPIYIDFERFNCSESWWVLMLFCKAVKEILYKGRPIAPVPGDCPLCAGKDIYPITEVKHKERV